MIEKEARLKVINLSRLEEIKDLRTVWPHEALDFTPWLSQDDNISLLADAVEMDITVDETESSVGDFNVDIFASETGTDRKIIIENQLEDTNHDHLGKLITYASGKSADVVIWVVKHAREEHKAAIEWLNNHTDDNVGFFLCEIKLYRIGSSEPAVKFEVVERPNDWTKEVRKSESVNETQQSRYDYWVAFEDYVFNIPAFAKNFKRRKPSTDHTSDQNVFTLDTAFQRRWEMRLIENNFEHVDRNLADAVILDTGITWEVFCTQINNIIVGNNARMTSAEDKRLGAYFVHLRDLRYDQEMGNLSDGEYDNLRRKEEDKSITEAEKERLDTIRNAMKQNRKFPEKVIKYLWDDAFKFNREVVFETSQFQSLEQVIRTFMYAEKMDRFVMFKENVRAAFTNPEE